MRQNLGNTWRTGFVARGCAAGRPGTPPTLSFGERVGGRHGAPGLADAPAPVRGARATTPDGAPSAPLPPNSRRPR